MVVNEYNAMLESLLESLYQLSLKLIKLQEELIQEHKDVSEQIGQQLELEINPAITAELFNKSRELEQRFNLLESLRMPPGETDVIWKLVEQIDQFQEQQLKQLLQQLKLLIQQREQLVQQVEKLSKLLQQQCEPLQQQVELHLLQVEILMRQVESN